LGQQKGAVAKIGDYPDGILPVTVTVVFPSVDIPNPKKYEGTVATAGTPVTLPVNDDLGKNAGDGYITCDGAGDLLVDVSKDGTDYETAITIKNTEVLLLGGLNIHTIKIDATQNGTAYRVLVV